MCAKTIHEVRRYGFSRTAHTPSCCLSVLNCEDPLCVGHEQCLLDQVPHPHEIQRSHCALNLPGRLLHSFICSVISFSVTQDGTTVSLNFWTACCFNDLSVHLIGTEICTCHFVADLQERLLPWTSVDLFGKHSSCHTSISVECAITRRQRLLIASYFDRILP